MWYFMLKSGVHATITGVLLAFAIPFAKEDRINPSYKLQYGLHKPVSFLIIPIFALANTSIIVTPGWIYEMTKLNSLGIILGLVAGKPIGILIAGWALVKSGLVKLPPDVTWRHLTGAGALAGIRLYDVYFIANLAFTNNATVQISKISILIASLLAAITGLGILFSIKKTSEG